MATATKKATATPARRRLTVESEERVGNVSRRRSVTIDEEGSGPLRSESSVAASTYFASPEEKDLDFISSGCAGLDAALGGGYVVGRVVNIVGDKSAGKTLLAIEACANFHRKYPPRKGDKNTRYAEGEAAFDKGYAGALGMPLEAVEFSGDGLRPGKKKGDDDVPDRIETVEDFYDDVVAFLDRMKGQPCLYILDSLDSLSDDAEMERDIDKGSFGAAKAKKMSELFRKIVRRLEQSRCLLIVISQIRDKIGVTFGETKTRSGGRALDFYASHIIWLAELGKISREIDKVKRVTGVNVRARVKKNKVGLAHREFEYPVLFGYGIDDLTANAEWLVSIGAHERLRTELDISKSGYKVRINKLRNKGGAEATALREGLRRILFDEWQKIERQFLPSARKY